MSTLPPKRPDALDPEYSFLVTDDAGAEHDLGPLVNRVISMRLYNLDVVKAPERLSEDGRFRKNADLSTIMGVHMGIKMSVQLLFGEAALTAFEAHCAEVERFLKESDGVRH